MSLNITVTKKVLETIVHETFTNFGFLASSSLLDSFKLLGFYYATNAGISINIEDLKTPDLKKRYLETAKNDIEGISQAWLEGKVSDQERFQFIIDSWNLATESLKNRIVDYYQDFDPANNLYIMAFSGARGNMSQVRQLVGMRGLMSDQEGKIIDLPIQANFREGLNSIDYIISSYGARKGIVDTALKTADSGYLTRRLIYLAQDLIIRELDCKTQKGVLVLLKKKSSTNNLIGRHLVTAKLTEFPYEEILKNESNKNSIDILDSKNLENLKAVSPLLLTIRSSLTCQSKGSLCQKCYGWDLAHQKLISLGEAVGILAAQSIGEPGTQLTMRTFHTGGIFTGENLKQLTAPFSGKIILPESLKAISFRTNHGVNVLKLEQEAEIQLINWQGFETTLQLEIDSYLYISQTTFVYQGQLIAEILNKSVFSGQKKFKPIFTHSSGKVVCNAVIPSFRKFQKRKIRRILLKQGLFWITSGKIISLPSETEDNFLENLSNQKAIGRLKIITPNEGIIVLNDFSISIINKEQKITVPFDNFTQKFKNTSFQIVPLVRNYQYVDANTILAFLLIFSNSYSKNEIFSIEKKSGKLINTFFLITKKDIWHFYGPSIDFNYNSIEMENRTYSFLKDIEFSEKEDKNVIQIIEENDKKEILEENVSLDITFETNKNNQSDFNGFKILNPSTANHLLLEFKNSGLQKQQDRYFSSFQHFEALCLPTSSILNYIENDLVNENTLFATLVNYSQQTDDIVQGLPKIEELIEARQPVIDACLSRRPGIFLQIFSNENQVKFSDNQKRSYSSNIKDCEYPFFKISDIEKKDNFLRCIFPQLDLKKKPKKVKKKKQILLFLETFVRKRNTIIYDNNFYTVYYFSPIYKFNREKRSFTHLRTNIKLGLSDKKYEWKSDLMPNQLLNILSGFFKNQSLQNEVIKRNSNLKKSEIFSTLEDQKNYMIYKATNKNYGTDYIFEIHEKISIYLKQIPSPYWKYFLPNTSKILIRPMQFVDLGEPMTEGIIDSHQLLSIFFEYHKKFDGIVEGTLRSIHKFQLILANSIQSIYQSQGVNISSKHIEIIVRQMTSKVIIKNGRGTPFLPGELISLSLMLDIYFSYQNSFYKTPIFEPKLLSATNSSLNKDGFLSAAGFQETRKILTKAAIEGTNDWLRGLKESIMSGRMIPAGSAYLNYKNYLDTLYFLKKSQEKKIR
jgi:hypothetical protein